MERFVSTIKGKKVRNNVHIHDDLVSSILSKLPLKSCKRFRCVRKSWSLLFKNPNFMNEFRNHFLSKNNRSDYSDIFLLLSEAEFPRTPEQKSHNALYLLPNEKFKDRIKLDFPPPFEEDNGNICILNSASINGILCLEQHKKRGSVWIFKVVLWNPATHEFMVIPPSPDESVPPHEERNCKFHGFGYDPVRDDYKVIRYIKFFLDIYGDEYLLVPKEDTWHDPMFEIYSLRSNSWRIIHANLDDNCYFNNSEGVYLNGMCHWWTNVSNNNSKGYLMSFDFTDEVFLKTPMMLELGDRVGYVPMVLHDSVALISYCYDTNDFHISILGDLGEEKSWFKLCIIRSIPSIERPIGVWKNGNIYFHTKNYEPIWINLNTRLINEIDIKRENYYGYQFGIYKENILSRIGGTHN